MRQYFIYKENRKEGPFDLEELHEQSLTRDMMVWYESLNTWTKAENIPELKPLLYLIPPPLPETSENDLNKQSEVINSFSYAEEIKNDDDKRSILLPILITLIIIAGLLITLFNYHK